MQVGDLVKYKSKNLTGPNPVVLVVKVWSDNMAGQVSVVDSRGSRTGRFADQLEVVSESR